MVIINLVKPNAKFSLYRKAVNATTVIFFIYSLIGVAHYTYFILNVSQTGYSYGLYSSYFTVLASWVFIIEIVISLLIYTSLRFHLKNMQMFANNSGESDTGAKLPKLTEEAFQSIIN